MILKFTTQFKIWILVDYDLNPGHSCKDGFFPITSGWQECEDAVNAIGFNNSVAHVEYEEDWGTSRPQGCFQSDGDGRIHFNQGVGGNSIEDDKILCKRGRMYSQYITYPLLF